MDGAKTATGGWVTFVWSKKPGRGSDFIPTLHLLNAVCDISQLCCHFWAGVQCLFPAQYLPGSPVFGGLVFGTWLNGAFYMNFFVVHRFLFIFMPFRVDFIITRLVTQLFTAATLIFLFLYMCMSTTVLFISYSATALSWAIDWRHSWEPGYRFLFFINELSNYLYVYFNLPFYLAIGGMVVYRKRLHKSQMKARDLYLIMQMLISWLLSVVCWFLWEVFYDQNEQDLPKYLKNSVAWMLWNGFKPLSTLITLGKAGLELIIAFETDFWEEKDLKALEETHTVIRMKPEPCPCLEKNELDFMDPPIREEKWRWFPLACAIITIFYAVLKTYEENDHQKQLLNIAGILLLFIIAWGKKLGWGPDIVPTLHLLNAICDIFQLLGHFWGGFQSFFPSEGFSCSRFFGGLVYGGWFNRTYFVVHRFVYIFLPFKADRILTPIVGQIFVLFSAALFLIHMGCSLTLYTVAFNVTQMSWAANRNASIGYGIIAFLNEASNYALVYFNLPFYVASQHKFPLKAMEIYIILQMLVSWLLAVLCWVVWELFYNPLDSAQTKYFKNTLCWMIWNGFKPTSTLLTLLIRPNLIKPETTVRTVTVTNSSQRKLPIAVVQPKIIQSKTGPRESRNAQQ
ncbi:unnamed protein product, partial [Mesorhabditis spiculigera]